MVEQTSPDAYEEGVSGSGDKWKDRVDTDRAESNFTGGITDDAASELVDNAQESSDDYADNLAEAFGLSSVDNDVVSEWESEMDSSAADEWQSETSAAGDTWRDGVDGTSASDWEDATSEKSSEWFNNTKDSLSGN